MHINFCSMDDALAKVRELKERVKDLERAQKDDHNRIKKLEQDMEKLKDLKVRVKEYLDR